MANELDRQRARAARNRRLFREVNERIKALSQTRAFGSFAFVEYVCECTFDGCTERIRLTNEEYEGVRRDSDRFFVLPGHEVPEVEDVVESSGRYVLVAKLGEGASVTKQLDHRR